MLVQSVTGSLRTDFSGSQGGNNGTPVANVDQTYPTSVGDTCCWAVVLGWQGPEKITGPPKDDLSGGRNVTESVMAKGRLMVMTTLLIASWKQGHNEPQMPII